jgi:acid stress chaperone HdeA
MEKWIGMASAIALALGALSVAGPAHAASKTKQVDKITCEEFLALDPASQERIAFWVDGYVQAKNEAEVGTVAFDKFGQPLGALVDECQATPKATLWEKIKAHLHKVRKKM